jgi:hypothetical protein
MPCYDYREVEDRVSLNRFACEVLTQMEAEGKPIPDYIQSWWKDHKQWDEIQRDMAKHSSNKRRK